MSALLTRRFLPNDTDTEQPAGLVSQIFGLTLKEGDLPAGEAPIFKINGVAQKYSWGLQSPHNDGSLLHASVMLLCSVAIPAKSKVTVEVWSGGTAPAPSKRIFAEVAAQDLRVGGEGIGVFGGLTGEWWSYLTADSNNIEQLIYMDGDAGKTWRVNTNMAQTPDGPKHGQLMCYHYVTALTDSSGNLGGFRHLARINQPYYNLDTPTKALRAFKNITTWCGDSEGADLAWPFDIIRFTTEANTFDCTVANGGTHNFYNGAQPGEGSHYINCVPGYLSATTDPALSTEKIYFAYTYGDANNNKVFRISENTTGLNSQLVTQGGTGTFVPIPVCLHAGSIWTADPEGRSNFFQGTGSMVADCVVRTQYDPIYLHSTGAIPPWGMDMAMYDIPEIVGESSRAYWANNPTWNPVTERPLCLSWRGGPGSVPDIGPLTTWACAHFHNQSAVGDMAMRSIGFASDFDGLGLRDTATGNYVNFSNSSYAGLPAPSQNQQTGLNAYVNLCIGFEGPSTPPARNVGFLSGGQQEVDHKPQMAFYPFLIFGEPHFYDLMIEASLGGLWLLSGVGRVPVDPPGYGIVLFKSQQGLRGGAWALRDLMLGANFAATVSPDGSRLPKYLNDLVDNNMAYALAIYDAKYLGTALAGENCWRTIDYTGSPPGPDAGGFMMSYFECVMAWMAGLGNGDSVTWLNKYAKWINYVIDTWGGYLLYSIYDGAIIPDDVGINSWEVITSFDQYGMTAGVYGTLKWTNTGTRNFTATAPSHGYVVMPDDKFVFMKDQPAPSGFEYATPYYVGDVSGNSFSLYVAPPASPALWAKVIPTDSGEIIPQNTGLMGCASPYCTLAAPPPASSGECPDGSTGTNDSYLLYRFMAWNWAKAAGASGYENALADATTRLNAKLPDFSNNANWYGQYYFGSSPITGPTTPPTEILMTTSFTIKKGHDIQLNVVAVPEDADLSSLKYRAVPPELVTLAPNAAGVLVTPLVAGTVQIFADVGGVDASGNPVQIEAESDGTITGPLATSLTLTPAS